MDTITLNSTIREAIEDTLRRGSGVTTLVMGGQGRFKAAVVIVPTPELMDVIKLLVTMSAEDLRTLAGGCGRANANSNLIH